ncbi:Transposon TX1 uncharacterized 149 kDa protein [Linum grandiflorum]
MRIRVRLDVRKSLKKEKVVTKPNKEILTKFQYEKLPTFCFLCGRIGHIDRYCPIRWRFPEGADLALLWDASLRAPFRRITKAIQSPWLVPSAAELRAADIRAGRSGSRGFFGARPKPPNIQELANNFRTGMAKGNYGEMIDLSEEQRAVCITDDRKRQRSMENLDGPMDVDQVTTVETSPNERQGSKNLVLAGSVSETCMPTVMIILSWNCRGLGQDRAVRALEDLIRVHRPDMVFLIETLVAKQKLEEIRVKLKFDGCFAVDVVGRSGGLGLLWRHGVVATLLNYSRHSINMQVTGTQGEDFRLTGFYGEPDRTRRKDTWELLRSLAIPSAWCVIGDFNELLSVTEKHGTHPHPQRLIDDFRLTVEACDLQDIDLEGHQFTWWKSKGTSDAVEERLDRAMVNPQWTIQFPKARLVNSVAPVSDHSPLVLYTDGEPHRGARRTFRFENWWRKEVSLKKMVEQLWRDNAMMTVEDKLRLCRVEMEKWSKQHSMSFRRDIKQCKHQLDHYARRTDEEGGHGFRRCRDELNDLLGKEEAAWKQRAKQYWMRDGDLNTKFFHRAANGRRAHKALTRLQGADGTWEETDEGMGRVAVDYFRHLFSASQVVTDPVISAVERRVTDAQNTLLLAPIQECEVREACFLMHPDKAPGPDGLNPAFYQHFWDTMGKDISANCKGWIETSTIPAEVRATNIILLPKKPNPTNMRDVRPISLCDVRYRMVAKLLASRMRKIMPHIIPEEQSGFIQGRSIVDNVLIAFETLHALNTRRRAKHGEAALKIDISKAYDRVEWPYLEAILTKIGFAKTWVDLMMMCVKSVEYTVTVNSVTTGPVVPKRGLRQGCPLSPFLFVICAEGLSALIR